MPSKEFACSFSGMPGHHEGTMCLHGPARGATHGNSRYHVGKEIWPPMNADERG